MGSIMLHLEEFVEAVQQQDSVAGMMRFLVAHFKMVVHKIMPEGSPEEVQKLLEDDPDYFNDLEYDEVVKCMTHILLVADELFPAHRRRCDEATGAGSDYSEVRGVHRLSWAPRCPEDMWGRVQRNSGQHPRGKKGQRRQH